MPPGVPNRIPTMPLEDWGAFHDAVDSLGGWIFRGHGSSNWKLLSTLDRHVAASESKTYVEHNFVTEFKRRAHNYLRAQDIPTDDGEWLALMQHFGSPTRLLDFTYSPYVAAYFALEDLPADGSNDSTVWAISPGWCHMQFGRIAMANAPMFGYTITDLDAGIDASLKSESKVDTEIRSLYAGSLLSGFVGENARQVTTALVTTYDPLKLSERMSAQQGVFLWPGNIELTFMENLDALGDPLDGIRRIVIPHSARGRALEQLRAMNITRTSLFPGLDGFAQSFRQKLVREPPQERVMRMALLDPWLRGNRARTMPRIVRDTLERQTADDRDPVS